MVPWGTGDPISSGDLNTLVFLTEKPPPLSVSIGSGSMSRSWHSGEEIYLYHNIPEGSVFDQRDRELSDEMASALLSFVRTSDPNHEGLISWPMNSDSKTMMGFGDTTRIVTERSLALYEILDEMQGFENKK